MKLLKVSFIFFILSVVTYGQESISQKKLVIGASYWNSVKFFNNDITFEYSSFGMPKDFIDYISISPRAKEEIKNANTNIRIGSTIMLLSSCSAGALLGIGTNLDSPNQRNIFNFVSLGTIMVGILVGNIFTNEGFDRVLSSIYEYNEYIISSNTK